MAYYRTQQGGGPQDQILQAIMQALQEGKQPEEIIEMLVGMGVPQQEAAQMIQMVMQQMQQQMQQPSPEMMPPQAEAAAMAAQGPPQGIPPEAMMPGPGAEQGMPPMPPMRYGGMYRAQQGKTLLPPPVKVSNPSNDDRFGFGSGIYAQEGENVVANTVPGYAISSGDQTYDTTGDEASAIREYYGDDFLQGTLGDKSYTIDHRNMIETPSGQMVPTIKRTFRDVMRNTFRPGKDRITVRTPAFNSGGMYDYYAQDGVNTPYVYPADNTRVELPNTSLDNLYTETTAGQTSSPSMMDYMSRFLPGIIAPGMGHVLPYLKNMVRSYDDMLVPIHNPQGARREMLRRKAGDAGVKYGKTAASQLPPKGIGGSYGYKEMYLTGGQAAELARQGYIVEEM